MTTMGMDHSPLDLKQRLLPYRAALYDFDPSRALDALEQAVAPGVVIRMCTPFQDYTAPAEFFEDTYLALAEALPDLECRDFIRISGTSQNAQPWVGIMGNCVGEFAHPFLGIPPTRHLVHMRYHEFYRFEDGKIAEVHAIWDIPELMYQARAWPMAPALGREWCVPGPSSMDGLADRPPDSDLSAKSVTIVEDMLEQMKDYPAKGGPDTMQLDRFWHPKMSWYGPSGIGSSRGFDGFIDLHMKPWVDGMPNWSDQDFQGLCHFFGDGHYVGETGWPAMQQTLAGDGFRGLPPTGAKLDIRCLDFWRLEGDLIRENWVMVDLLHMYQQLGIDVLARMAQLR